MLARGSLMFYKRNPFSSLIPIIIAAMMIGSIAYLSARVITLESIATDCKKMQDEKELLSSLQELHGVSCTYSINGYGASKRTRKATKG